MVYLYDYLQGIDFAAEKSMEIKTDVYLADRATAETFINLQHMYRHLDYTQFSKYHHENLTHYDFSLQRIREHAAATEGVRQ